MSWYRCRSRSDGSRSDGSRSDGSRSDGSRSDGSRSDYLGWQLQPPAILRVAEPSGISWREAHERIVELARRRATHERELCHWLLEAERLGVHKHAGYASFREYTDRLLGLSGRQTEERLRVGRALLDLPELELALTGGELCWAAVRELTRVATTGTERKWISWAKGRRSREVDRAVAERKPGEHPDEPGDPKRVRHRFSFEVQPETAALLRDAIATVRKDLGEHVAKDQDARRLDDDSILLEIARRALGGPRGEGRGSYQVAVSRCDTCGKTQIDAGGQSHEVSPNVAAMFDCDAQYIGRVDGKAEVFDCDAQCIGRVDGKAEVFDCDAQCIGRVDGKADEPAGQQAGNAERPRMKAAPNQPEAFPRLENHSITPQTTGAEKPQNCRRTGDDPITPQRTGAAEPRTCPRTGDQSITPQRTGAAELRERPGTGAGTDAPGKEPSVSGALSVARATQSIPPSIRRLVTRRHRGRCAMPGCQNHCYLDVHHIDWRCEGGTHDPERLILLCGAHHRVLHEGYLHIEGRASTGFRFQHADGLPYGAQIDTSAIDIAQQVLGALVDLGFKRAQAQELVAKVQRQGFAQDVKAFLRAALLAT